MEYEDMQFYKEHKSTKSTNLQRAKSTKSTNLQRAQIYKEHKSTKSTNLKRQIYIYKENQSSDLMLISVKTIQSLKRWPQ